MTANDFKFLFIFAAAVLGVLIIAESVRRFFRWSPEATRKIVHMLVGVLVAATPFVLDSMWPMVTLGLFFTVVDFIAVKKGFFKGMHGTVRHTYGTVFYPISFVILTVTLWNHHKLVLVTAMLIMALSDAAAAIVGERMKNPIILQLGPEKKTLQGSAVMFTVTLLLAAISLWIARQLTVIDLSFSQIAWIALAVAVIAMASEMISAWGSDNLSVPLSSAFALYYLLNEPWAQALMFFLGMALAAGLAVISYRLRFLNGGGSVALFLLGTLVFGAGGWKFALPILTFFLISSAISKMGRVRKQKLEKIFEKGSRRDIGQVLANGGIAGLMLLFWYFSKNNFFYVLYIASLAAVTADTWATEIGVMSRGNPRSILTFRPVAMGTSGGISFVGTTGALLGSVVLSVTGYLCSPHASPRAFGFSEAFVVVFAGLAASLVDSLLGATVQAQYQCPRCGKTTEKRIHCQEQPTRFYRGYRWINNDVVNAFCAVAGVLFVWLAGLVGIL